MLRVLVLDQARGVWGAQRYLLRLAPLMRECGVELVLGTPGHLELCETWRRAGFEVVELALPVERSIRGTARPSPMRIASEAVAGIRTAKLIAGEARRGRYDALWANAHWIHAETALAGRLCDTPVVLHLHEEALPGIGTWLRAAAVSFARSAVAVSKTVRGGLPDRVANDVVVIPNGVDTEVLSPAAAGDAERMRRAFGVRDGEVLAVAATRLDPSKRIEDLVEAVRLLAEPRLRLVIAGSTSGYPEYAQQIVAEAARSCGDRIVFCGNREDMPAVFGASDLVIHAGTIEGMPLGLIEAQSCGKPVVAYDVAGVSEAVNHGKTGLLCKPCDVVRLSQHLGRLAGDPELRSRMGAAARAHVLANHRIGDQAARNVDVIKHMCGVPQVEAV